MVGIAQLVSASGCGPEGRGFESHYSPHIDSNLGLTESKGYRQAVRHQILILAFVGSNPATPARNDSLAQQVEHRTFNAMVRSSNLRWVTRKRARQVLFFFFLTSLLQMVTICGLLIIRQSKTRALQSGQKANICIRTALLYLI